jgi:hypothetical protein
MYYCQSCKEYRVTFCGTNVPIEGNETCKEFYAGCVLQKASKEEAKQVNSAALV